MKLAENMVEKGVTSVEKLEIADLQVDMSYQNELDISLFRKLKKKWDEHKAGFLTSAADSTAAIGLLTDTIA